MRAGGRRLPRPTRRAIHLDHIWHDLQRFLYADKLLSESTRRSEAQRRKRRAAKAASKLIDAALSPPKPATTRRGGLPDPAPASHGHIRNRLR